MTDHQEKFHLVDTKVGNRAGFNTVEDARSALVSWVEWQRGAGEPVVELPTGQWKDSKLTIWISGLDQSIVPLKA